MIRLTDPHHFYLTTEPYSPDGHLLRECIQALVYLVLAWRREESLKFTVQPCAQ